MDNVEVISSEVLPPRTVSRARRNQLKHLAKGLCEFCGKPPVTKRHCAKCRERVNRLRREAHRRKHPLKRKAKNMEAEFETLVLRLKRRLEASDLPESNAESLAIYLHHGVIPGSFMRALIENNLVHAAMCADHRNKHYLFEWASFLYNHMPSDAWGSAEKVLAYAKGKQSK